MTTDLLRAGSPGTTRAGIGDLDVAPRQACLSLELAHGRVGGAAASANRPHHRLAFRAAFAVGDAVTIDGALLLGAALGLVARIRSCGEEDTEIRRRSRRISRSFNVWRWRLLICFCKSVHCKRDLQARRILFFFLHLALGSGSLGLWKLSFSC